MNGSGQMRGGLRDEYCSKRRIAKGWGENAKVCGLHTRGVSSRVRVVHRGHLRRLLFGSGLRIISRRRYLSGYSEIACRGNRVQDRELALCHSADEISAGVSSLARRSLEDFSAF